MNYSRNNANAKKIAEMTPELRAAYLASGRVTVDYVEQVEDRRIKRSYVAKIRGVIVGNTGEYMHDTPGAAKEYGNKILAQWQSEFLAGKHG